MDRQTIFVAAYPKSGSTYLTRLLGDVLDSPTGGSISEQDEAEVATEGQDRPGPYVIRKGHFVLVDNDDGPAVPEPHRLAWKRLRDERIVFLVRDPRDICISGAYHWRTTPEQFLDRMIKGDVASCGRWDEYINAYFEALNTSRLLMFGDIFTLVRYEELLNDPWDILFGVLRYLSLSILSCMKRIDPAIERQSFATRSAGLDEAEMRRNNMRLGIAGDWRNHFTPEMNERIWNEFGGVMEILGYER